MDRIAHELWSTPRQIENPTYARGLIGLSLVVLLLAALGLFVYDGLQRVAYVSAFVSIGLGNLAWGLGSLLPEEGGGRASRQAARPFFIVMLLTLPAAVALEFMG